MNPIASLATHGVEQSDTIMFAMIMLLALVAVGLTVPDAAVGAARRRRRQREARAQLRKQRRIARKDQRVLDERGSALPRAIARVTKSLASHGR